MADRRPPKQQQAQQSAQREPMTREQRAALDAISRRLDEPMDENLSREEAQRRIDELHRREGTDVLHRDVIDEGTHGRAPLNRGGESSTLMSGRERAKPDAVNHETEAQAVRDRPNRTSSDKGDLD